MKPPGVGGDGALALVLDTNVVLDWLVFGNAAALPIEAALRQGRARWLVSAPMRSELERVLGYAAIAAWRPDRSRIDAIVAALAHETGTPSGPSRAGLQCSDRDDQKFIDLALAQGALWLLTRDRAVLRLARRARPLGLEIVVPERFVA